MSPVRTLQRFRRDLRVDGVTLGIAGLRRDGTGTPIVFLHGFGTTKEDYADIILHSELDDHAVLAYDAPGCGATCSSDLSASSISFFVAVTKQMLAAEGIDRFHLAGHSMGGLTGLLLADEQPERIASFINIEGNLAPEDCFFSRQIVTDPAENPGAFLSHFTDRAADSDSAAGALYSASLPHKVRASAVRAIFTSIVDLSDHGRLLERFLALPMPRMFMYGEQNNSLSYLSALVEGGVKLAEISHSGHFPMYSNPPELWKQLTQFIHGGPG
jgi:pimeloyl-ACP methyl ester carboxylesterase